MADEQKHAYRASARAFLGTLEPAAEGWAKG
jgi:deoxyribodipyrimidine photolyase-related protein